MRLDNKVAIVTGGGRGLGKAMAKKMSSEGAAVAIVDVDYETCVKLRDGIIEGGQRAVAIRCDVANEDDVSNMVAAVIKEYGRIDILVNNAGITRDAQMVKMTVAQWDIVMDTNLKSMFLCSRQVSNYMIPMKKGRIINISSISGEEGNFGQANYSASKAGAIGLTKTLSKELGRKGITVNAIAPGFIITEMTDQIPEKVKEQIISRIPLGRGGHPEEVAAAVVFLASDEAGFINGHTLNINGGMYV